MKANYVYFIQLSSTNSLLDYSALAALAAVIREGSFDRAARALHVTPSAVSQRIRLLEERVGCALVVRDQPCRPTDTGRRLCQHIDRVRLLEQELQAVLPAIAPQDGGARVPLPIAVNADSLATWLVPAIAAFAASAPVLVDVSVDDEGHTAQWLRSGAVLAAVTAQARPTTGCNSRPLGAMRYVAAASPDFVRRHFAHGVTAGALSRAPSLMFSLKDNLQTRWARRLCHREVELPRHALPSTQAFVTASVAGMGWGMHPIMLAAEHLQRGTLVELVADTPLDIPLYWHHARAASALVDGLSRAVLAAARSTLRQR